MTGGRDHSGGSGRLRADGRSGRPARRASWPENLSGFFENTATTLQFTAGSLRVSDRTAMTITLDYTDLRFDDDRAVLLAEEGDFHYELLLARTVFRVDGADFSIQDEKVPLLDFAFVLRTLALELPDGEKADYESPLSWLKIEFARSDESVGLSANFTDATATVTLTELRQATADFQARVMQDLVVRYPKLPEDPAAQKFFAPGGPEPLR